MSSPYPFYPREPVRVVHFGDATAPPTTPPTLTDDQKKKEIMRDVGAAVAAFSLPIAYSKYAPKKWPKSPNLFVDVLAVIGVYFTARWAFNTISGT